MPNGRIDNYLRESDLVDAHFSPEWRRLYLQTTSGETPHGQ